MRCMEYEHELDEYLNRRHSQLIETIYSRPKRTEATIRFTLYNTFANQELCYHTSLEDDHEIVPPPSWSFFIEGSVENTFERMNHPSSPTAFSTTPHATVKPHQSVGDRKFSSFFQSILIEMTPLIPHHMIASEKSQDQAPEIVEWKRPSGQKDPLDEGEVDGFELKRIGTTEQSVRILLTPRYFPVRYRITHPGLAKLLCIDTDTKSRVVLCMWHYIKSNNLISTEDPHIVQCNEPLRKIFGTDEFPILSLPQRLQPHFGPVPPIELTYKIALSGDPVKNAMTYEVVLDIPSNDPISANVPGKGYRHVLQELENNMEKIFNLLQKSREKYQMYSALHESPVQFMKDYLESQINDFKLAHTDDGYSLDSERNSEFFYLPFISEAVQMYLHALE